MRAFRVQVQCALIHDGDATLLMSRFFQGLQRDLAQLVAVLVDDGAFEEKSILPSPGSTVTMQSLDSRVPAVAAFFDLMLFSPDRWFLQRYTVLAGGVTAPP